MDSDKSKKIEYRLKIIYYLMILLRKLLEII